jgi:hypothetical protein
MMDSGAKERELEVLKRRVVLDTNELNQLNLKIMQANRKVMESDPKQSIANNGGVSSSEGEEGEADKDNKKKRKRNMNNGIEELPNLKIVKMEEQINQTLREMMNLKTGQILDE